MPRISMLIVGLAVSLVVAAPAKAALVEPAFPVIAAPPEFKVLSSSCLGNPDQARCPKPERVYYVRTVPRTAENATAVLTQLEAVLRCQTPNCATIARNVTPVPILGCDTDECYAQTVLLAVHELVGADLCLVASLCTVGTASSASTDPQKIIGLLQDIGRYCVGEMQATQNADGTTSAPIPPYCTQSIQAAAQYVVGALGPLVGVIGGALGAVTGTLPDPDFVQPYLEPPEPVAVPDFGLQQTVLGRDTRKAYGHCSMAANAPKTMRTDGGTLYAVAVSNQQCQVNTYHEITSLLQQWRNRAWRNMASAHDHGWNFDHDVTEADWRCQGTKSYTYQNYLTGYHYYGSSRNSYTKSIRSGKTTLPCGG